MPACVEGRIVDGVLNVELFPDLAVGKVDASVGLVVSDEIGPPEESGFAGLVDFVMASGSARSFFSGIRTNVAPVKMAGFWIKGELPRVATAHDVDFGSCAFGSRREKVAFGNGVSCVRLNLDAN